MTRHATAVGSRHNLVVDLNLCAEPALPLDAREALYNIVKHAQAQRVILRLYQADGNVILEIEDDGVGFNPTAAFPGHLGLRSMRERARRLGGSMEIKSAPAWGAPVRASLPTLKPGAALLVSPPKGGT